MKYVMLKRGDQLIPVIFPDVLVHRDIAKALQGTLALSRSQVVSAGLVDGLLVLGTSGDSKTLGVESRPEDARTILCHDYAQGHDTPNLPDIERLVLQATQRLLTELLQ